MSDGRRSGGFVGVDGPDEGLSILQSRFLEVGVRAKYFAMKLDSCA